MTPRTHAPSREAGPERTDALPATTSTARPGLPIGNRVLAHRLMTGGPADIALAREADGEGGEHDRSLLDSVKSMIGLASSPRDQALQAFEKHRRPVESAAAPFAAEFGTRVVAAIVEELARGYGAGMAGVLPDSEEPDVPLVAIDNILDDIAEEMESIPSDENGNQPALDGHRRVASIYTTGLMESIQANLGHGTGLGASVILASGTVETSTFPDAARAYRDAASAHTRARISARFTGGSDTEEAAVLSLVEQQLEQGVYTSEATATFEPAGPVAASVLRQVRLRTQLHVDEMNQAILDHLQRDDRARWTIGFGLLGFFAAVLIIWLTGGAALGPLIETSMASASLNGGMAMVPALMAGIGAAVAAVLGAIGGDAIFDAVKQRKANRLFDDLPAELASHEPERRADEWEERQPEEDARRHEAEQAWDRLRRSYPAERTGAGGRRR